MNEEFELKKANYNAALDVKDVILNPVVTAMLSPIRNIPVLGCLVESSMETSINTKIEQTRKALTDCIIKNRNITSDQVNDVDFIINLNRTCEAVQRLTINDKVLFFGNLLRNGYLSDSKIDPNLFDEFFSYISDMSYRELVWLWKYFIFCDKDIQRSNMWFKFKQDLAQEEQIDEELVVNIFSSMTRTGLVKQPNVMFPDGQRENPYVLTELFLKFSEYVMSNE